MLFQKNNVTKTRKGNIYLDLNNFLVLYVFNLAYLTKLNSSQSYKIYILGFANRNIIIEVKFFLKIIKLDKSDLYMPNLLFFDLTAITSMHNLELALV